MCWSHECQGQRALAPPLLLQPLAFKHRLPQRIFRLLAQQLAAAPGPLRSRHRSQCVQGGDALGGAGGAAQRFVRHISGHACWVTQKRLGTRSMQPQDRNCGRRAGRGGRRTECRAEVTSRQQPGPQARAMHATLDSKRATEAGPRHASSHSLATHQSYQRYTTHTSPASSAASSTS
jgi:hypothetical protein